MINQTIIKAATHRNGKLTPEGAADIQIYLEFPNKQNWSRIASLRIIGHTTLWQAVCKANPEFTKVGRRFSYPDNEMLSDWVEIPEPETVLEAIKIETERNRNWRY